MVFNIMLDVMPKEAYTNGSTSITCVRMITELIPPLKDPFDLMPEGYEDKLKDSMLALTLLEELINYEQSKTKDNPLKSEALKAAKETAQVKQLKGIKLFDYVSNYKSLSELNLLMSIIYEKEFLIGVDREMFSCQPIGGIGELLTAVKERDDKLFFPPMLLYKNHYSLIVGLEGNFLFVNNPLPVKCNEKENPFLMKLNLAYLEKDDSYSLILIKPLLKPIEIVKSNVMVPTA